MAKFQDNVELLISARNTARAEMEKAEQEARHRPGVRPSRPRKPRLEPGGWRLL